MFTTNHFIWMAICTAFIGILLFLSLKFKFSYKTSARIMALIALTSELTKIFTHIEEAQGGGGVLEPGALPLHLCSILIFLVFYCALSNNERLVAKITSFCTPVAIWGGVLAILMATSGVDFAKPYAYQCFIYHAGLIWWAMYLLITKQVNLGLKSYLRNMALLGGMLYLMIWVNSALSVYDTNFWYVVRPPVKGLPLLNLDNGWYAYFLTIQCIGLVALTIVHLPAILRERRTK